MNNDSPQGRHSSASERFDRDQSAAMAIIASEMADPGSTGVGTLDDAIDLLPTAPEAS